MKARIAKMAVSAAKYHIDKPYDYLVPENLLDLAIPGKRALVPFGKGKKPVEAVILSITTKSEHKRLKQIDSLPDESAVFSEENLKLALWMSDRFFCSVFDALKTMLPASMLYKEGGRPQGNKTISIAYLAISEDEAAMLAEQRLKRAPRQSAIIETLIKADGMPVKELSAITNSSTATIKTLEKQGIISLDAQEVYRRPNITAFKNNDEKIKLNSQQNDVLERLTPLLESSTPEAALLFGVTGSGKTIIYIKLIERAIALGKTSIVLVPEIALTPQTVNAFSSFFGDSVAVIHSALGTGERYDEWKRIRSGEVKVVIGTRSAIFAPLSNLGLIVIDEEQEHTYKSEKAPRYHARDIAKFRVNFNGALLLLASATPSIESMHAAKTGKYTLLKIETRFNEKSLPPVIIVDMRKELKNGNGGSISSVLRSELEYNFLHNEQSILFINRRGASPVVACGECGYTFKCLHCSVSMTYHSIGQKLLCHYCGFSQASPNKCPECTGVLKLIGAGTQKVETELNELFPGVSIIRMDADAVSRKNSHDKLLSRFRETKAQILLGTQMVTKGLDFENVTLVGVISADSSLYMSDFRAHEKSFSLITQVIGRSGRGEKSGRAVIQTFSPEHEVLRLASKQDYNGFYEREITLRESIKSPPIYDLLVITVTGANEEQVISACMRISNILNDYFSSDKSIRLLGPAPVPVIKVKNKYRYRLMISCKNTKGIRDIVAHTIKEFMRSSFSKNITVFADTE